jgi:IS30 family transposase
LEGGDEVKKYTQLTLAERERLYALKEQGISLRTIAKKLGRSHTSLSRELRRNVKYGIEYFKNEYLPCKAESLATKRKIGQRKKASLKNPTIYRYVKKHLIKDGWSPEIIAGRLRIDHSGESITKETIYRYIYSKQYQPRGNGVEKQKPLSSYLPLARKKRMQLHGRRVIRHGKIPFAVSIEKRPKAIVLRKRIGHWETDNVIGKQTDKTALSVTVERKILFTLLTKLMDRTAMTKKKAVITRMQEYPRKTLTADNGKENTYHQEIAEGLAISMYFCHAYASWEKPSVENMNGRIRRYIPKGISIDTINEETIAAIEYKLNHTPRKRLSYLTPCEKMQQASHKPHWCTSQ